MPVKFDTTLMRLIKDVNEIKAALRHVTTNLPLFDIANENTPASLSTDQNNYVPGNYDVLRINATVDISITGIANGKKGRFLEIVSVGTGRISYPDESASSIAINRIATPYDQTVVQLPNARVRFYYDSTAERWTVADLPNIQGTLGKIAVLKNSALTIVSVPAGIGYSLVSPNTVVSDDWGYWNSGSGYFVIPTGESGLYSLSVTLYWSTGTASDYAGSINVTKNGTPVTGDFLGYEYAQFNVYTGYSKTVIFTLNILASGGDTIRVYANQNSASGINRDLQVQATIDVPVFVFAKVG